jgi:dihydrodipicolinate synthase/N-acetylneuraminate lyase
LLTPFCGFIDGGVTILLIFVLFSVQFSPTTSEHVAEVLGKNIDGIISGCANLDPKLVVELWKTKGKGGLAQFEALRTAVKQAGDGNYLTGLKILLKHGGWLTDARLW